MDLQILPRFLLTEGGEGGGNVIGRENKTVRETCNSRLIYPCPVINHPHGRQWVRVPPPDNRCSRFVADFLSIYATLPADLHSTRDPGGWEISLADILAYFSLFPRGGGRGVIYFFVVETLRALEVQKKLRSPLRRKDKSYIVRLNYFFLYKKIVIILNK